MLRLALIILLVMVCFGGFATRGYGYGAYGYGAGPGLLILVLIIVMFGGI